MKRRPRQCELEFPNTWGGKRTGSGRKPKGPKAGVAHAKRSYFRSRSPVHVTVHLQPGIASLRTKPCLKVIRTCVASSHNEAFLVAHYSIQNNHLHLICEAGSRESLARGIQGLNVRLARRLNALMDRAGKFFSDRYHAHVLATPREVRSTLAYVLNNWRRHSKHPRGAGVDPFASGMWFGGWRESVMQSDEPCPLRGPSLWLLNVGWKRHGLIMPHEIPGRDRPRSGQIGA